MFERFTHSAREVVVYAQVEAGLLGHGYIGTEHLLLGVLREGDGAGARVLKSLGVDLDTTRADVVDVVGKGPLDANEKDAEALRAIGIDVDEVRRRIEEAFGPGALDRLPPGRWRWRRTRRCDPLPGHVPFTHKAKKVLQLSLREATALGHGSIGTEHILLGLAREREGIAAQLLQRRGAGDRDIRRLVATEIERGEGSPGRSA
jgi:ATP-dependent Clp protease ATP-binding subunit ClpA